MAFEKVCNRLLKLKVTQCCRKWC